jgi:CBS domain-containing protein
MKKVSDVLSRKVIKPISISPETKVIDALRIMAEKNIGSVLVMNGEEYLGIITERDYSRKVVLKGKSSTDTPVSDIMTADGPKVHPSDTIDKCMQIMTLENVRYLPVVENDKITGIISMYDVVRATILSHEETISSLKEYLYANT